MPVVQDRDPLQEVLELSNVPRPRVVHECAKGRGGNIDRVAVLLLGPFQEVADQRGGLFASPPEPGGADLRYLYSGIEVPAEIARPDRRLRGPIPCGG